MDHSAQQAQYNLDSIAESERDQSAFNSLYQPLSPNPAVISANASIQSHPIFGEYQLRIDIPLFLQNNYILHCR